MAAGDLDPAVEAELAHLSNRSIDDLKARWLELKGVPLPKFMRRGLITRAVAHAIQEAAYGGLDPATRKRLDVFAAQIVPKGGRPPPRPNRVKPGTRLIRAWKGRVHEVTVVDNGFAWNGATYRSLSVIARHITGTRWNGWVFFGLKQRQEEKDSVSKPMMRRQGRRRSDLVGDRTGRSTDPRPADGRRAAIDISLSNDQTTNAITSSGVGEDRPDG